MITAGIGCPVTRLSADASPVRDLAEVQNSTHVSSQRIWAQGTHLGERVPLAWVRLLAAQNQLTRPMDQHLRVSHDLTINDYEVLLKLSQAPEGRLTRSELARSVHLTHGGITRLLAGLERAGLVESADCPTDRRVVYAELTATGRERFREAVRTHLEDIRTMFSARFSSAELETLADLLGRLTDAEAARGDAGSAGPPAITLGRLDTFASRRTRRCRGAGRCRTPIAAGPSTATGCRPRAR